MMNMMLGRGSGSLAACLSPAGTQEPVGLPAEPTVEPGESTPALALETAQAILPEITPEPQAEAVTEPREDALADVAAGLAPRRR